MARVPIKALATPGPKAFGLATLDLEKARSLESYLQDLQNPTGVIAISLLMPTPEEPDYDDTYALGDVQADRDDTQERADREARLLLEGTWVGSMRLFAVEESDWTIPSLLVDIPPECPQTRYHIGNSYLFPGFRGVKDEKGCSLFKSMHIAVEQWAIEATRAKHPDQTSFMRTRGIVEPESAGRLLQYYGTFGFEVAGWIPQVTSMLANRCPVVEWPIVQEDPASFLACRWAVVECVGRIDDASCTYLAGKLCQSFKSAFRYLNFWVSLRNLDTPSLVGSPFVLPHLRFDQKFHEA
ncbi:hypothetical protein Q7P37_004876 [Cladosporium fusiforme]